MTLTHKSNQQTAAVANRRLILSLLRQHRTLSRRQLSQMSGLRDSTLTYIVRELIARKLVRTAGLRESRDVGKKQILLELDPRFGYAVGVEIHRRSASIVLMDAAGIPLRHDAADLPPDAADLALNLRDIIHNTLAKHGAVPGELLGVGVGISGAVDANRGVILKSTQLRVTNLPLGAQLTDALGAPALVDHNANFAALAEAKAGAGVRLTDFIQFTINHERRENHVAFASVGAALMLRGELYRGVHFGAGELDSGLAPSDQYHGSNEDLDTLANADAPLTPMLEKLADAVGVTLAHLVNFLDPQAVILSGSQRINNLEFLAAAQRTLRNILIPIPDRTIKLLSSPIGPEAVAHGAAWAAIESARTHCASASL